MAAWVKALLVPPSSRDSWSHLFDDKHKTSVCIEGCFGGKSIKKITFDLVLARKKERNSQPVHNTYSVGRNKFILRKISMYLSSIYLSIYIYKHIYRTKKYQVYFCSFFRDKFRINLKILSQREKKKWNVRPLLIRPGKTPIWKKYIYISFRTGILKSGLRTYIPFFFFSLVPPGRISHLPDNFKMPCGRRTVHGKRGEGQRFFTANLSPPARTRLLIYCDGTWKWKKKTSKKKAKVKQTIKAGNSNSEAFLWHGKNEPKQESVMSLGNKRV